MSEGLPRTGACTPRPPPLSNAPTSHSTTPSPEGILSGKNNSNSVSPAPRHVVLLTLQRVITIALPEMSLPMPDRDAGMATIISCMPQLPQQHTQASKQASKQSFNQPEKRAKQASRPAAEQNLILSSRPEGASLNPPILPTQIWYEVRPKEYPPTPYRYSSAVTDHVSRFSSGLNNFVSSSKLPTVPPLPDKPLPPSTQPGHNIFFGNQTLHLFPQLTPHSCKD
ncbi:hypothetical protein HOY80DRAFT_1006229 [Tuber brumale]|nr:hypothetical protein HOY80DRAFT_1006229 [Tuber brumale]